MAGAMSGAKMMGLSIKRAGKVWVDATGEPGKMGGKAGFDSPGTKRAGNPHIDATGCMGYDGKAPSMGK